jgi:hypothetical protein
MRQQSTVPNAPVATAPQAPPATAAPSQEELARQIRDQVRAATDQARQAARAARDAAHQAAQSQSPNAPVIAGESGTLERPFDPNTIPPLVENVASYFFVSLAVIVLGVTLIRALARRFLAPPVVAAPVPAALTEQMQRIENTVESMAIEIERISEAQRFLTKLQSAKPEPVGLPRPGA